MKIFYRFSGKRRGFAIFLPKMKFAKPLCYVLLVLVLCSAGIPIGEPQIRASALVVQSPAPAVRVTLEPVVSGLVEPVLVTHAGDSSRRIFILERRGVIKVLQYGESQPSVFLDITDRARFDNLGGLLGLAFHPQYRTNGRFFILYLRRDETIIAAEFRVSDSNPNVADPSSEKYLLTEPKLLNGHMGGTVEFGPDGYLYISLGDGSPGSDTLNNAQNLDSLLGKILRLDVDHTSDGKNYASPGSNPFYGATLGRDEIYAYGFRNPYRFSFDKTTGQLYVGDVGERVKEEIDVVTAGGNYGWRVMEGTRCTNFETALCSTLRALPPLIEYDHADGGCAVTGGYVYRGARATFPLGAYIYGDLCSGKVFMYNNGQTQFVMNSVSFLSSFGSDEDGELYAVGIINGSVYRIVLQDPDDPQVQLLAPNQKMKLKGNKIFDITWNTTGVGIYRHDIQWSKDGGTTWEDVVGGLPGATRSYTWTVPNIKTTAARIRVISYGNRTTGQDESDEDFIIKPRSTN
ncbi:MAG: PQQ-dependent sugar dehydrogenase [Acidobacteria bacterium]|nr:PQQ-dependent sugar dehydrogenase [Acidobacteriota bacterium]